MTNLEELRQLGSRLPRQDAKVVYWAFEELRKYAELKTAESWRNPYTEAIAILENHARAFEGGYG